MMAAAFSHCGTNPITGMPVYKTRDSSTHAFAAIDLLQWLNGGNDVLREQDFGVFHFERGQQSLA